MSPIVFKPPSATCMSDTPSLAFLCAILFPRDKESILVLILNVAASSAALRIREPDAKRPIALERFSTPSLNWRCALSDNGFELILKLNFLLPSLEKYNFLKEQFSLFLDSRLFGYLEYIFEQETKYSGILNSAIYKEFFNT